MMLISTENSTLKSKLRRLEEDNLKKVGGQLFYGRTESVMIIMVFSQLALV